MSLISSLFNMLVYKAIVDKKTTLSWSEVQYWMIAVADPNNQPYQNTNRSLRPFGEVHLSTNHDFYTIKAEVSWTDRGGVIAHKSWTGNGIDVELKKMFGHNRRFRIEL